MGTPVDTATIPLTLLLAMTGYLGEQPYIEVYEMLDEVALLTEVTEYLPENVRDINEAAAAGEGDDGEEDS